MFKAEVRTNSISGLPALDLLTNSDDFASHIGAWDEVLLDTRVFAIAC